MAPEMHAFCMNSKLRHFARPPRLLLILDEVHHLPAQTFHKILSDWSPPGIFRYVLGLSGTMRRADGKITALFALMNNPVYSISAIEMNRKLKLLWIFNVTFPIGSDEKDSNDDDDGHGDNDGSAATTTRKKRRFLNPMGEECPEKQRMYKYPNFHMSPSPSATPSSTPSPSSYSSLSLPEMFQSSMFGTNPFLTSLDNNNNNNNGSTLTNNSNVYRNGVHGSSTIRSRWVITECIERYLCGSSPPATITTNTTSNTIRGLAYNAHFPPPLPPCPKHILIIFNTIRHLQQVLDAYEIYALGESAWRNRRHLIHYSTISVLVGRGAKTRKTLEDQCARIANIPKANTDNIPMVHITLGMVQLIGEGYDDASIDCVMLIEGKGYGELSQSAYRMRHPESGTLVYISSILLRGAKRVKAMDMHALKKEVYAGIEETRETNISIT
jgi:hypothetical protein